MDIRLLTTAQDLGTYESWIAAHPHGSLWQSLTWKRLQEALGRGVKIYAAMETGQIVASALVVIDRTALGLSTWDIPRGPLAEAGYELRVTGLLGAIIEDARKDNCMALYFSPLTPLSLAKPVTRNSQRFIYPEATRLIDLRLPEHEILDQMKPKGRYNIRLAEKHGVTVRVSDDIDAYAALSKETGARDGFTPQRAMTYRKFLETIPGSFLLLAYSPSGSSISSISSISSSSPIAGLLGLIWGTQGIYYYGASGAHHRELMAPYLLQWEAMKLCKGRGCHAYDLFGIAPENQPDHPWSGVSEFKAKFGGTIETYSPERAVVLKPVMKGLLELKRKLVG